MKGRRRDIEREGEIRERKRERDGGRARFPLWEENPREISRTGI